MALTTHSLGGSAVTESMLRDASSRDVLRDASSRNSVRDVSSRDAVRNASSVVAQEKPWWSYDADENTCNNPNDGGSGDLHDDADDTVVLDYEEDSDHYEGTWSDYVRMTGVGIGPGADQTQYRNPASRNFQSSHSFALISGNCEETGGGFVTGGYSE